MTTVFQQNFTHSYFFPSPDQQEFWYTPKVHIPFQDFSNPDQFLIFPFNPFSRIWRILTLLSAWGMQLLSRIMRCFQSIQKVSVTSPKLPEKIVTKDLDKLFNEKIDYEKFRDSILSYKCKGKLFYNNYRLNAYAKLKGFDAQFLLQSQDEKIDFQAGSAVYNAIVDLYVNRFLENHPELDHEAYLSSLRTIALGIAIKISWDEPVWNIDYQKRISPYMGIKKHLEMEMEFLKGIDWDLSTNELIINNEEG